MKKIAKFEKVSLNQFQDALFKEFKFQQVIEIYNRIKLPTRATKFSAGYDFFAPFEFILKPNQSIKIPTGIRVKMENNFVLLILPRSSLGFKYRLQLDNTVGVVDADYYNAINQGHIFIKVSNNNVNHKLLTIKANQAFAQGIFIEYGITIDDEVGEERIGGFGSTNIKK